MKNPRIFNIDRETITNENFRHVIHTGPHSQVVLMSLLPKEEIGMEVHHVDQFLRIESGTGRAVINHEEHSIKEGTGIFVPAGAHHNVINTGDTKMKLYTIYSPANHIAGRIHKTKADAEADDADEEFGNMAFSGKYDS